MLPRKVFENVHTGMDVLALFEQIVTQILFLCLEVIFHQIYCIFLHIFDLCVAKGLFALNAILIRFVVVRNFVHFLTKELGGNISTYLEPQQFCFLSVIL